MAFVGTARDARRRFGAMQENAQYRRAESVVRKNDPESEFGRGKPIARGRTCSAGESLSGSDSNYVFFLKT
jgi:hypothetical protein